MQNGLRKDSLKLALVKSLLIALCVLICFALMKFTVNGYVLTAVGASTFLAFAFPNAESSKPRYLLGGYACGIVAGMLGYLILSNLSLPTYFDAFWGVTISCVIAVFLASLFMLLLKVGHPPAAAVAITVTVDSQPLRVALISVVCIVILSLIKLLFLYMLKKHGEKQKTDE